MKIVLTGGGSGGHFYPLIAVAEEINTIVDERNLVKPELYYISNDPYNEMLLYQNEIEFKHVHAGKLRRYFSIKNATDFLRTLVGLPTAIKLLFRIYPDVVFSKGSYVSVPVVMAARLLRIPVFVHDSDAVPGRANLWAAKFAKRIGISYPDAAKYFSRKDKVAFVGNPIRREVRQVLTHDAHTYFSFVPETPTILVLGGSQGAEVINNTMLRTVGDLLNDYQVIHQVGSANIDAYTELLEVEIKDHPHLSRYRIVASLNALELRTAAGAADIIVSRAGSSAIYEIATWQKPAILVPIPESVSRDQRENAYAYARAGGCEVIEQHNFTPHVLTGELKRIWEDEPLRARMVEGAKKFQRPDAAKVIAQEIIRMALEHEL